MVDKVYADFSRPHHWRTKACFAAGQTLLPRHRPSTLQAMRRSSSWILAWRWRMGSVGFMSVLQRMGRQLGNDFVACFWVAWQTRHGFQNMVVVDRENQLRSRIGPRI